MAKHLQNVSSLLHRSVRSFATVKSSTKLSSGPTPSASASSWGLSAPGAPTVPAVEPQGPLRPHLKIPVNPNHGLYGFFRVKTDVNSHTQPRDSGHPEYVSLEAPTALCSGRAWNAAELRRKSFTDLHTLWYVLLRERNLLATQSEEKRKLRIGPEDVPSLKAAACRQSMARIKAVISERRHAYQHAIRLRRESSRRGSAELQESGESVESAPEESMLESDTTQGAPEKTQ